jgi:hypothetical protein
MRFSEFPWQHPLEDPVSDDQRMKQDRSKVSEERQEKKVGEYGVRQSVRN